MVDTRVRPLVPVDRDTIESMCAPIAGGIALGAVASVDGGLVNTLFRVTTAAGIDYALRVSSRAVDDSASAASEIDLLCRLEATVPVPSPVVVDLTGERYGSPYLIYRWIDGITLNDCRRSFGTPALASLAEPIGRLMGTIAGASKLTTGAELRRLAVPQAIATVEGHLQLAVSMERLSSDVARALCAAFRASRDRLCETDDLEGLIHGDFSGRNVIVRADATDAWTINGVLDWETASIGSPLWDLGSLFRYAGRYDVDFRRAFAQGYRATGRELPDEWWYLSRLLDTTRLVATLAEDRELPSVFDDCRVILADVASVRGSAASSTRTT